ncbi:MAG: hypothetical protein ACTSR7_12490 [Promethearchaeota archaeon]
MAKISGVNKINAMKIWPINNAIKPKYVNGEPIIIKITAMTPMRP